MAIVQYSDWELSGKGHKDAERHRKKIDKSIREQVRNVIAEESIITKKKGRKVKVPIKGLKDWKFLHGHGEDNFDVVGTGTGDGKPGKVIKKIPKQGQGQGSRPGDTSGENYIETEIDIDYLIEIMFDDLGLPFMEEKTKHEQLVPKGWKFKSISKRGIIPRLHKKRTVKESIKRTMSFIGEIIRQTNCEENLAKKALSQSYGDLNEAISLIENDQVDESIDPDSIFIEDDDLRFKKIVPNMIVHSNAVVIAMMDVSGSMTTNKKYLARSMLFWMVEFLRKTYETVEIKFIIHTTESKIVDEHTFFHSGESGGTKSSSAFETANYLIDTEYPTEKWNVYPVYISDGEDWSPDETIIEMNRMVKKGINMLSYAQIELDDGFNWSNTILDAMKNNFKLKKRKDGSFTAYEDLESKVYISIIKEKEDIYKSLKHFLFEKVNK